jgi:diguanylate cyclase (GGDEF)-like protein
VPAILAYGIIQGVGPVHALVESSAVAILAVAAVRLQDSRRQSTLAAVIGLLTSSAVLVHLSGGLIEMHFHYFVMVGVVTLYQDWEPFLVAIAYVVLQHGVAGAISPGSVYNHQSAIQHPWEWAAVHGVFILGMSAAGIASWRFNEILLRHADERLSLLTATLDATAEGVLVVDREGRITSANARFAELWHIPEEVMAGGDDDAVLGYVVSQLKDPEGFRAKVAELYAAPEIDSFDVIEFVDGRVFERTSKPQRVGQEIVGRVWSFRDVTERRRLEMELSHQAFHDSLTGLANQALFRDRVGHALTRANRGRRRIAVLFLDVDNFKTVNDSLGHTAGDQVLVSLAQRLLASVRLSDTAARLGGDEFAVLLEDLESEAEVLDVAARLLDSLRQPFAAADREVFVSASIGVVFDDRAADTDQLLRNADLAMYTAKRRGRGRYEVFEAAMHSAAVDRLEIEHDLRLAIEAHDLYIEYQPVVSLRTGLVTEVEALARWDHPTRGPIPPTTFIPLAEETGLIRSLGRRILLDSCTQFREWQRDNPALESVRLSVNLSTRQLHDGVVDQIVDALAASGLPAANLVLEITESAMMQDTDNMIERLHAIRSLGVQLAIDDFGTGYSSLGYLQQLPIDILKIDRAFVIGLDRPDDDGHDHSLPEAIVALAHSLGLKAVAEGVEGTEQLERLAAMGCDAAQGYHLARPLHVTDVPAALRRRWPVPAGV